MEDLTYYSTDPLSEIITKRRRKPRMKFTEEELADTKLSKTINSINKAEDKLDKALKKKPTRYKLQKERVFDETLHTSKIRLKLEEVDALPKREGRNRFRYPTDSITLATDNALKLRWAIQKVIRKTINKRDDCF